VDRRLDSLRALKRLLDEAFRVPGTNIRFGWDPLLGLIPWAGDALTALFGIGIILQAHHMRVPKVVQLRMLFNLAFDLLLGVVPFLGDAVDFIWKANAKNFDLLERHVRLRSQTSFGGQAASTATTGDWVFVIGVILVIVAVALAPLFVLYWVLNAIGAHLPAFPR
jgi:Domain of unknown function (DUF4112)